MGIWESMSWTADSVKRNVPDLSSPIKNAWWSSYGYASHAVTSIDNVVRVSSACGKIKHYTPQYDDETVAKIGRYGMFFAKNTVNYAVEEGLKSIPGGRAVSRIWNQTSRDEKAFLAKTGSLKKETIVVEKKRSIEKAADYMPKPDEKELTSHNLDLHYGQKPEDAIRIFMMKEFMGRNVLGDLLVPEIRHGRRGTGAAASSAASKQN